MTNAVISSFRVKTFVSPLKKPFITALGRKTETINAALELELKGGARGYGEASASLALAHLRPERLAQILGGLGRWSLGRDAAAVRELSREAWRRHPEASPAVSAFESAVFSALCASSGAAMSRWLGGRLRRLETDITLSASDEAAAAHAARSAAREGFNIFKIKVGGTPAEDLPRVKAAAAASRLGKKLEIILDGNQGLSEKGALRLVDACLKAGLNVRLLEQPLAKTDWAGMARLARSCPVPIAADEMVMTPADAVRAADSRAAGVINIKAAKSGIFRSLEIASIARAAGLELMIGCMAETARGLSSSVALAMGTGFFRHIDLDSDHLLRDAGKAEDWSRKGRFLTLD